MTEEKKTENEKPVEPIQPKDQVVITKHKTICGGHEIAYTAAAGRMVLKEEITVLEGEKKDRYEGEKPCGEIFFTAYTKDDVKDINTRPVTFAFNGGPGSASIWVHMGMLGPKRVKLQEDGLPLPPPAEIIENEYSILDMTDLVFIDPIGTGFSRAVNGETPKEYWGWKKDVESVGEFIRQYITRNQRWASPKFIAGESYGTTRTVGLADYLSEKHGMYLNGILLISTALDFSTLEFFDGNELPYVLFLPTYAADAWYHRKLSPEYQNRELTDYLNEVRTFAGSEYLQALFRGSALSDDEKKTVAKRIAGYTGLSEGFVLRANLRVEIFRFCKELLRDRCRTIGRLDSRYIGIDKDAAGEIPGR